MHAVSSSAHSNNFKLTKTPKPIKLGFFKNPGLTQKTYNSIKVNGLGFLKNVFFQP